MENKLFTLDEVARLMQVNPMTVRRWIKTGRVAVVRLPISNSPRIPQAEVDRLTTAVIEGARETIQR